MKNKIIYISVIILLIITNFIFFDKYNEKTKEIKKYQAEIQELNSDISTLKETIDKQNNRKNSNIIELTYDSFTNLLETKEKFIVIATQTTCGNCHKFLPVINEVFKEYNITGYEIDLLTLSKEDYNIFTSKYNVTFTPTTLLFKDGDYNHQVEPLVGNLSKEKVIEYLKNNNYIN